MLNSQADYRYTLVPRLPFPVPCSSFSVARCPLPVARCPLPVARCPLPVARCPLPVTSFSNIPFSQVPFSQIVALEWQTLSHLRQFLHPRDHRHHRLGTQISRPWMERYYIVLRRRRRKLLIAVSAFCHIRWYFILQKVVNFTQAFRAYTTDDVTTLH